jgi:cGMP-dependent protein kinase 2
MFQTVSTLSEGQTFGELALNSSQPRAATMVCKQECSFAVMQKHNYKKVLEKTMK